MTNSSLRQEISANQRPPLSLLTNQRPAPGVVRAAWVPSRGQWTVHSWGSALHLQASVAPGTQRSSHLPPPSTCTSARPGTTTTACQVSATVCFPQSLKRVSSCLVVTHPSCWTLVYCLPKCQYWVVQVSEGPGHTSSYLCSRVLTQLSCDVTSHLSVSLCHYLSLISAVVSDS